MKTKICCECCGNQSHVKVANKRNYDLYLCESCGLIFVWPQPLQHVQQKLYDTSEGYYTKAISDLSKTNSQKAHGVIDLLASVGLDKGRLLDVGCSTGSLMFHLKKSGWDVCGVEINPGAVEIARQNGLDVSLCEIENSMYQKESFDVIHMGDVIEHVNSPSQLLYAAYSLLKHNGIIVIRTPNAECSFAKATLLLSRYFGLPWPHSEAPYHLFDFSPDSLCQLLMLHGFQIIGSIEYENTSRFAYIIGGMGYFDDLKRNIKKRLQTINSPATIWYVPMLVILTIFLFPIYLLSKVVDRLRCTGNVMHVVAQRSPCIKTL